MSITSFMFDNENRKQYEIHKSSTVYFLGLIIALWGCGILNIFLNTDVDKSIWNIFTILITPYFIGKSKTDTDKKIALEDNKKIASEDNKKKISTTLGFRMKFGRYCLAISVVAIYILLIFSTNDIIGGSLTLESFNLDDAKYGTFIALVGIIGGFFGLEIKSKE